MFLIPKPFKKSSLMMALKNFRNDDMKKAP